MRKSWIVFCVSIAIFSSPASYARNYFGLIFNTLTTIAKQISSSNSILSSINSQQSALLTSQRNIEELNRQVNSHLTGHSGWGNYQFHDYQSYGDNAHDWNSVMRMAETGQGRGALGETVRGIANQFPSNSHAYNRSTTNVTHQKYYALKSQTVLAIRAASQLDYDKIAQQIAYQQMLQQQIEKTQDLKAAIDLSNRIQVEGNLINLAILRQAALANQHQAIVEQGSLNSALSNAKFLTK